MTRILFDLETLPVDFSHPARPHPERVWCCCAWDFEREEMTDVVGHKQVLQYAGDVLAKADELSGHNIAAFDMPVLEHHGWEWPVATMSIYDTKFASRLIHFSTLFERSIIFQRTKGKDWIPDRLLGAHSLEAWGYRLQEKKATEIRGTGAEFFEQYSEEMLTYCRQDVKTNVALYHHLHTNGAKPGWPAVPAEAVHTESFFGYLLQKQERNGVGFDVEGAKKLAEQVASTVAGVDDKCAQEFPPWIAAATGQKFHHLFKAEKQGHGGYTVYKKRTQKPTAEHPWPKHWEGAATKLRTIVFNVKSPQHRTRVLQRRHGWQPTEFSKKTGAPTCDEDTMSALLYPEIPLMLEGMMLHKRLGQISGGAEAWLNHVTDAENIHGRVNATGARTLRCSHSKPNCAQVPKVVVDDKKKIVYGAPGKFGAECRDLFRPTRITGKWTRQPWKMVGVDASGIELRCLANRLWPWDGGAFAEILLKGDIHEAFRVACGLFTRYYQKNVTYSWLYGAGAPTVGKYIVEDWHEALRIGITDRPAPGPEHATALASAAIQRLLSAMPALAYLLDKVHKSFERGYIIGIDGRVVVCKTEHGSLNDLLQGDGALVMKVAKRDLHRRLLRKGYLLDKDFAYMLDVHDEWQTECKESIAEEVGKAGALAIQTAGEELGFNLPLAGEYRVGDTWKETH